MTLPKDISETRPTSGIANDIPASQVADEFYTSGNNMQFRGTFAERSSGHAEVYAGILTELRNINNQQVGGINYWVYQGIDKSSVVTELTHTDITIAAGLSSVTEPDAWTSGLLNGVYFANNGIDAPMYWDGIPANKMLELPGWVAGTTCQAMVAFKNFLIAMNITTGAGDFEMLVNWSSVAAAGAVPGAWVPSATNLAGSASLSETKGGIIDALPLGGNLIIYKGHSAYSCQFVDLPDVFSFQKLPITFGALSRHCIADLNGKHLVVSDGDIMLTDGNTGRSIIDNKMRKFMFDNLDQDNFDATFVVSYTAKNEVWVCFPTSGNSTCDKALIYDTQADNWGVRDVPGVTHGTVGIVSDVVNTDFWDDDSQAWDLDHTKWDEQDFSLTDDSLVLAMTDDVTPTSSKLFQIDNGTTFDGTNVEADITKGTMSYEQPARVKMVKRVYPIIVADPGVEVYVRVGQQMTPEGSTTWNSEQTFTVGTTEKIDVDVQGKFISYQFRSDGLKSWQLVGWNADIELRGYF